MQDYYKCRTKLVGWNCCDNSLIPNPQFENVGNFLKVLLVVTYLIFIWKTTCAWSRCSRALPTCPWVPLPQSTPAPTANILFVRKTALIS